MDHETTTQATRQAPYTRPVPSRRRLGLLPAALGALAAVVILPPRPAVAGQSFVLPNVQVRNGDWVSVGLTAIQEVGDDKNLIERFELGLGGASVSAGFMLNDGFGFGRSSTGAFAAFGARATQTFGLTSWRDATYAGPEIVCGSLPIKVSVALMIDVRDRQNLHPQFGLGFGF